MDNATLLKQIESWIKVEIKSAKIKANEGKLAETMKHMAIAYAYTNVQVFIMEDQIRKDKAGGDK
jgi:hypothetical protein